ncbi:hypothetical protein [Pseudomonas phage vB_Pae_HMKU_23]|nr:hypothetical protein [Pseudomonas phage vB_Pae_HMKU_23]
MIPFVSRKRFDTTVTEINKRNAEVLHNKQSTINVLKNKLDATLSEAKNYRRIYSRAQSDNYRLQTQISKLKAAIEARDKKIAELSKPFPVEPEGTPEIIPEETVFEPVDTGLEKKLAEAMKEIERLKDKVRKQRRSDAELTMDTLVHAVMREYSNFQRSNNPHLLLRSCENLTKAHRRLVKGKR